MSPMLHLITKLRTITIAVGAVEPHGITFGARHGTIGRCRSPFRPGLRPLTFMVVLAILVQTLGCGSGFTNDSVPDGRSVIKGRVVLAASPTTPLANATVTITTTPPGQGTLNYIVVSGLDGSFGVAGIVTGPIDSNVTITVLPNDKALQKQRFSFLLTNNRDTYVIAAMPSSTLALAQAASVSLTQLAGAPPDTALVKAQVLDMSGNPLGIVPDMIFDDGVATVNADGTYTVNGAVAGTTVTADVTATIDNQTSNPPASSVKVTVGPVSAGSTGAAAMVGRMQGG